MLPDEDEAAKRLKDAIANGSDRGAIHLLVGELRSFHIEVQKATVSDVLGAINGATVSVPHASDEGIIVLCLEDSPQQQKAFQISPPPKRARWC